MLHWETAKFNLDLVQGDTRRPGVILIVAGVLNAIFDDGNPLTGLGVMLVVLWDL